MQEHDPNLNALIHELKEKFTCHTLILYGSRARGDANETSDYDIMGICETGDRVLRDARVWHGFYLDAFIYPEAKVAVVDASMLAVRGGIVLMEKGNFGTLLLQRVEALYAAGPPELAPDDIQVRRVWARKMLERARMEDVEGNFRRHWLLTALLEDYFLIRGLWYRGPKESFMWLQNHQPRLFRLYAAALKPNATLDAMHELVEEMARDFDLDSPRRKLPGISTHPGD